MGESRWGEGQVQALLALLDAQTQRIGVLERDVTSLKGRLGLLSQHDAILAAHLSTPLTALQRSLQTLHELPLDDPRCKSLRDAAQEQAETVLNMVSEMLEPQETGPAPSERLALVTVPFDGILEDALTAVADSVDRSRVEVEVPAGLMVRTSPPRLVAILANLLENAARHGGGGPIECRAHDSGDGALRLQVADRGPGLRGLTVEHLFEPGFAEAAAGAVSPQGMGLFLVRTLARSLGGDAMLEDRDGGGAVATVTLPQRRQEDLAIQAAEERAARPA